MQAAAHIRIARLLGVASGRILKQAARLMH
jgi:hypothetical protein